RLFVEGIQQGVATVHADGTIAYCNLRLAELIKVPHEKLTGAALHEFVVSADRYLYEDLLARGRDGVGQGEARLRQADGGMVPVYFTFNVLPPDCGGLIGVFITDLTTQKHRDQLIVAQEALKEADRRKNEFLAMLAHELRNPLAPMRNAVDILRMKSGDA